MAKNKYYILALVLGITGFLAYAASKFTSGRLVVIITAIGILGYIVSLFGLAFHLKNLWQILKIVISSLVVVSLSAYLILAGFVFFFQDAVANRTSSFFQPTRITVEAAQALDAQDVLPLVLITPDGIHLSGWLIRNSAEEKMPVLIYFGGSGSESSEMIPLMKRVDGWSVVLINYRGFGLSEGTPTHANTLADALFIYDAIIAREDIDSNRIVPMGYSLGTGVAVYLSEQRPTIGTILGSPYDYWTLIGLKQEPLYAPLTWMMKPYFDSISRAPDIPTPLLCLIGSEDVAIPPERSNNLVDAWGGETKVINYPGEDHGLLFHNNSSWEDIQDFLNGVPSR